MKEHFKKVFFHLKEHYKSVYKESVLSLKTTL